MTGIFEAMRNSSAIPQWREEILNVLVFSIFLHSYVII